jgi:hypothetical protein
LDAADIVARDRQTVDTDATELCGSRRRAGDHVHLVAACSQTLGDSLGHSLSTADCRGVALDGYNETHVASPVLWFARESCLRPPVVIVAGAILAERRLAESTEYQCPRDLRLSV